MNPIHHYTEEEKAEILSNPYTARVTDCRIIFTLEFKQFVMENIDKPGMTSTKLFALAGYRNDLFPIARRERTIKSIRKEAATAEGLKEPAPLKKPPVKRKNPETEVREMQERITILEQQIEFLKKARLLSSRIIPTRRPVPVD